MPIAFVFGRAGSGKTARCFERITSALKSEPLGPPIFLIVPDQATFRVERELTIAAGGFARARVVSFELLGREISASCGQPTTPVVTALGRQMILGRLLRQSEGELKFFRGAARQPGLPAELDATFAEFERVGQSPGDLDEMLDRLHESDPDDTQGPSFQNKLRDLQLLYRRYVEFLGQDRLDQHRRLQRTLAQLGDCTLLKGADVYVDDIHDFDDHERRMLAGLGRACVRVEINLTLDPASPVILDPRLAADELGAFNRTEQTYRRLRSAFAELGVEIEAPVRMERQRRFESPGIALIERSAFSAGASDSPSGAGGGDGVRFVAAPDPAAEVEATAAGIVGLLREEPGLRLRDIAVLARSMGPYERLIDMIFSEYGIDYFIDRRRSAAHHPLLALTRSMFRIVRAGWEAPAVMTLLKSGLAGVTLDDADRIENYLIDHRLLSSPWDDSLPWTFDSAPDRAESDAPAPAANESAAVERMRRRVVDALRPLLDLAALESRPTLRQWAGAVFKVFEFFKVRATLDAWESADREPGDLQALGEHEQVWAELVKLFDEMVDLLGEERISAGEFVEVLEAGLDRFDLALTPPTVDQALVGPIDRTRVGPVRAAFVLGLAEGQFPLPPRSVTILSHAERRELGRRRLELGSDPARRLLDEDFLGYLAFTRASRWLVVSRPLAGADGKPSEPSKFWRRLRQLLPGVEPVCIERSHAAPRDVAAVATPRQLVESVVAWARTPAEEQDAGPDDRAALYQAIVLGSFDDNRALKETIDRCWPALAYDNAAAIEPATAARLFPAPLHATARQLETFAKCPFRHFVKSGLRLRERESARVTGVDRTILYRELLEGVARELIRASAGLGELTESRARALLEAGRLTIARQLRGEIMMESARNQHALDRALRALSRALDTLRETGQRGRYRPLAAGVRFGGKGRLDDVRVQTPNGAEVRVSGSIDRVDSIDDGDAVAAFNYRLSAGRLSPGDLFHGLSLEMPTRLLALSVHGQALLGRPATPSAALDVPLERKIETVAHPNDATQPGEPAFFFRPKPRGVILESALPDLDDQLNESAWSDLFSVYLNKQGAVGRRNTSDCFDAGELARLLDLARRRIGELADEILAGGIDVSPFRQGTRTPCPHCEYRGVCRFEPELNGYRWLEPVDRAAVVGASESGAKGDEDDE